MTNHCFGIRSTPRLTGRLLVAASAAFVLATAFAASARQRSDEVVDLDHPAIQYFTRRLNDPVSDLTRRLATGEAQLRSEGPSGYLRSVLQALDVPVESQIAVFSKGSAQARLISARNPRVFYFGDAVVVGWVRGGVIEFASQDPERGTVFFTMTPSLWGRPSIDRRDTCLQCHYPFRTGGVPGMIEPGSHRRPFDLRWGGWYVTGLHGSITHLGNVDIEALGTSAPAADTFNWRSIEGTFDTAGYLTPYSDITALMVFEHQMQMMNLLTGIGWQARVARHDGRRDAVQTTLRSRVDELVDYMLFVDEAPITSKIQGTSGFADAFSRRGPRDTKGRSLRQLDLTARLMRFPCSYMIYSQQFERLPPEVKAAIYQRMWTVLSGAETGTKYARLTPADRRAIVEILRDTKKDLPSGFSPSAVL